MMKRRPLITVATAFPTRSPIAAARISKFGASPIAAAMRWTMFRASELEPKA
jgi:hypothetical protein